MRIRTQNTAKQHQIFLFCLSGFLSKFVESHRVMLQGNSNLKPKESQSAFAAAF
jgi:hypothetical protein